MLPSDWSRSGSTLALRPNICLEQDEDGNVVPWFDMPHVMLRRMIRDGVLVDREQFLEVLYSTGMKVPSHSGLCSHVRGLCFDVALL